MSTATLSGMGRKRSNNGEQPKKTAVVRVEEDVANMLAMLSTWKKVDVSAIATPILREPVEKLYKAMVKSLGKELESDDS